MKFSEAAGSDSKYLKAEDLKGRSISVVIESFQTEVVGKGNDARERVILYFQGKEKGMVCNVTNGGRLVDMFGDEMDGWIGREITLCVERVPFQGKMVPGLRVRQAPARGNSERPVPRRQDPIEEVTGVQTRADRDPRDDQDIPF